MALLMQLRRRLKTITTIKKITNAMRLISMSGHARLKGKELSVNEFSKRIEHLLYEIKCLTPEGFDPFKQIINNSAQKTLLIVVGSQKGLCGTFNTALSKVFEESYTNLNNIEIIAIGKKIVDYMHEYHIQNVIDIFPKFSANNLQNAVRRITRIIANNGSEYSKIAILSNLPKSFFVQSPTITQLLPIESAHSLRCNQNEFDDYIWEQTPEHLAQTLAKLYIESTIHNMLFQSLVAEQSARFLSMDNATRNAEALFELTTLQYNKLRQAKITKEISELISSM